MTTVTIHTAKTTLSQLLAPVLSPGWCRINRRRPRGNSALRGVISVGPEFFDPLPEQGLAAWE